MALLELDFLALAFAAHRQQCWAFVLSCLKSILFTLWTIARGATASIMANRYGPRAFHVLFESQTLHETQDYQYLKLVGLLAELFFGL